MVGHDVLLKTSASQHKKVGNHWSRVVGVDKNSFKKIRLRADLLLADFVTVCATKKYVSVTLCVFARGISLAKRANMRYAGVE